MRTSKELADAFIPAFEKGAIHAKAPWGDFTLDGREYKRAMKLLPYDDAKPFLKEGATREEWQEAQGGNRFTRDEIVSQLIRDAEFGTEKASGQRGISSSFMHTVCRMWLWVLEDDELLALGYGWYGQPLFNRVLAKYRPAAQQVN